MNSKLKFTLIAFGSFLLLLMVILWRIPLRQGSSHYCFYCDARSKEETFLGVIHQQRNLPGSMHRDGITIPNHDHRMIEMNSYRVWAFSGNESSDEFGWTAAGTRKMLKEALAAHPELHDQILTDYLKIDPASLESRRSFTETYGTGP